MDEPVPFTLTEKAELLALRVRLNELDELIGDIDRTTADLRDYATRIEGTPDGYEWKVVLELVEEVRDAYGLRGARR